MKAWLEKMCCVLLAAHICGLDVCAQERLRKLLQHINEPKTLAGFLWLLQLNKG